jgi:hypothetical protein
MSDISLVKKSTPTNADVGEKKLFVTTGGSLASIDEVGAIDIYSTGVSAEEVQDIVGALVIDSASVTKNYNDASNTLALSVVQSAIDHTQIFGIGSNTHAQIDSHISNQNNPHNVTKTQVGLSNVDNTSDVNKPISSATQVALNAKYDASNPNGYETPAQLNTRDTNNRARANHTGTQLASTISDLASSVRSTVLTGFTATNQNPVTSLDTVLIAIGKLQGQLDLMFNVTEQEGMLGIDYTNSSNTTIVSVPELGFVVNTGSKYYVRLIARFRTAATATGFAVTLGTSNGATGTLAAHAEITQAADATSAAYHGAITSLADFVTSTAVPAANTDYIAHIEGTFICTNGGSIVPQFRSEVNGSTATFASGSYIFAKEF